MLCVEVRGDYLADTDLRHSSVDATASMSKGAQVGVLDGDSVERPTSFSRQHEDAASPVTNRNRGDDAVSRSPRVLRTSVSERRHTASVGRAASRKLSVEEHILIRKTSVMLSNPAAAVETIFTHAELKRLEIFNSKYLGKPRLESSRSMRHKSQVRSSVDASSAYSELQSALGLSERNGDPEAAERQPPPPPEWLVNLRAKAKRIVKTDAFRAAVYLIVFADLAVLAMDNEYYSGSVYARLDVFFTLLIGLEIVIKSVAFGFYSGPESYLRRSRFRILNIVVLVASLLSHLGGAKFRVLRGIKTYRSLTMYSGLRRILRSLIRAVPFLANVGTLAIFFLLAFSIFGLEAYSGAYDSQCSIAAVDDTGGLWNSSLASTIFEALPRVYCSENASCVASNQTCRALEPASKHINFDSGLTSIFLVFLVVAQDGWVTDIMEPVLEGTSYWSVWFFVAIIATMVFLVVNLFVAVITTAFMNFTIDAESEEHQPRFMGRKDPDEEDTHVSLIMGATLAIEESIRAGDDEEDDDIGNGLKRTSRMSTLIGSASSSPDIMLDGKAREAMDMLAHTHQWKSIRDLTAEATKELIQNPSTMEEFMLPFAKVYQRHTSSSPKNANRGSIGESNSMSESPQDRRRSTASPQKPTLLVDIHETAPFESLNALVPILGPSEGSPAFVQFQKLVFSKRFDDFVTGCIVVNTFLLLLEYPNMNDYLRFTLSVSEYLFGSIFALEMIVRMIAMKGLRTYLYSTERIFDMIVVVCTMVNMVLNNLDTTFSGLNSISSLRTLRVSRLMLKWEGTRKLIMSVMKSSRGVMDVVVFLVLFQVVHSIIAMQLFGGAHLHSVDNTPRWNFDTFGRSFLTLLQVITGDQWSSIAYDAVDAENPHWFMVPFLIVIFIIGQYVLLNLFIAVILENFSISEEEAYQLQLAQIIAIPKELDIFEKIEECGVRAFGEMDQLENVSNVKLRMFLGLDDHHHDDHSNGASGVSSGRVLSKKGGVSLPMSRNSFRVLKLAIRQKWKGFCMRLTNSVWFSRLVQVVIVVSCMNLIIDDPHPEMSQTPPSDELTRALTIINQMVLFVLLAEFLVKVGAYGFGFDYLRISLFFKDEQLGYVNKQAYMEDRWNQLDFVLLVTAIIDEIVTGLYPEMSAAGVFRAGRVLRPLRILNHNQDMKAILTAVAQSVPQVGNVFALCMIVYIIFGVVGRSLFAGKFFSCNDSDVKTSAECVGFFLAFPDGALSLQEASARGVPSGAILLPRVWSNARFSFDHIGVGFLALLEMTSLKWIDKTFAAMDIAGQSEQPIQDNSPEFAIFFVLYVYIGSLFVIRLFVGVLVEQFQRNDGTQILTESQKSWVDLEKFILLLKPLRLIPRPRLHVLGKLYDFCQNPRFAQAISAAILLNILLLLVNPSSKSTVPTSYKVIEIIFLAIFTVEAAIKCLALRHYYLLSANGAFEVGILVGSLVAYFSASGYHTLIQAGRIFRVMRVLRFVKLNRGVYAIFQTFRASLRPIGHIFFLMCTIIFIFAIVARQLFGGIKFGPAMNHFSNFRTFGSSVLLLFQIMSGDDWHLTMTDCMTTKPWCSERVYERTGALVSDCGSVPSASFFFATYVTLVVFVFLNLFVTVILENFRSCYLKSDVCAISLLDFEAYREVFQKYDIHGKGVFPLWQLASFLAELPPCLRIERNRQRRAFLQIRGQVQALRSAENSTCNWVKRPYFNELLRILCIHQMGIRSLPYEQQRDRVKQIFIYRAKVAHMIVESVAKGYVYRWRQRRQREQLSSSLMMSSSEQIGQEPRSFTVIPSLLIRLDALDPAVPAVLDHSGRIQEGASSVHSNSVIVDAQNQVTVAGTDSDQGITREAHLESNPDTTLPLTDVSAERSEPVASTDDTTTSSRTIPTHEQPSTLGSENELESQSPHRHHHHHRKHHRHHKKKHHHHKSKDASISEDERSSDAEREAEKTGLSSTLEHNIPSDPGEAPHENNLDGKDTFHQCHDAMNVLVAKKRAEPTVEPSLSLLSKRLPRLNSQHHNSKVVPT